MKDADYDEFVRAYKGDKILRCKLEKQPTEWPTDEQKKEEEEKMAKDGTLGVCNGPIKAKVVFFGESLPKKFRECYSLIDPDYGKYEDKPTDFIFEKEDSGCDLMIVAGTALAVFPFCFCVDRVPKGTPKILMNLDNTWRNGYDFEDSYENPNYLFL